ncbi:hypothetical protein JCM10908_005364 [Rhodotorula pacifica]|uniref:uncharacterized protein n=1 Tax=Rhodotorula pacifica TaxID=1495444 RepID=UPI0031824BEF
MASHDGSTSRLKRARIGAPRPAPPTARTEPVRRVKSILSLPADVLARIAYWTCMRHGTPAVLSLNLTCRSFRQACVPYILVKLSLESVQCAVRAAEELGHPGLSKNASPATSLSESALKHVTELSIQIETVFPTSPPRARLLGSLTTLLNQTTRLTSLRLTVGPSGTCQPFTSLFPSEGSRNMLSALNNLACFELENVSLWLHELAELVHAWPALKVVHLESVRGDCTRMNQLRKFAIKCRLRSIRIDHGSMTNEMLVWLLANQTDLEQLSLPIQGFDGRVLASLEKVMSSLKSLDLRDVWAGQQRGSKSSKTSAGKSKSAPPEGEDAADSAADEDDLEEIELPPFFRMLKATSCPDTLHLNPTVLPSTLWTPEAMYSLTACMLEVETLVFNDFPASAGVFAVVAAAIKDDELPFLKHVEIGSHRGGSKSKTAGQGKGMKELQAACKARKIKMTMSTE